MQGRSGFIIENRKSFYVSAVNNTMTAYMEFTEEGKICLIIRDILIRTHFIKK